MMRIVLDDKPCPLQAESMDQAVRGAAALAQQCGRVIVDVYADGMRWTGPLPDSDLTNDALPTELRFVTADPAELVRDTLLDASAALQDADELQRTAAERIQSGDLAAALPQLSEAIAIWQSVHHAVDGGAELAQLDLPSLLVDGKPASQIIGRLTEQLRSLKNSLATADAIGLADTLLYELPDVTDAWRGLIEQMHAAVGQGKAGNVTSPQISSQIREDVG
jgi:hypothetical protein